MKQKINTWIWRITFLLFISIVLILTFVFGREKIFNQCQWEQVSSPTSEILWSIEMLNRNDGWAVGNNSTILRWNGSDWSLTDSPSFDSLLDIAMNNSNDGWAVGSYGTILHWDGNLWSSAVSPISTTLTSVSIVDSNDVWAVGFGGVILHWDGSAWLEVNSPTTTELRSISMNGANDGWAVGGGHILHWNGSQWTTVTNPAAEWLRAVYAVNAKDAWAMGDNGITIHWNGSNWSELRRSTSYGLWGIDMENLDNGWAISSSGNVPEDTTGNILHWDGNAWAKMCKFRPPYGGLTAIDMVSTNDGWAVGEGGVILRYSPPRPKLDINYQTGQPGSLFSVKGQNFAANSTASIAINNEILGTIKTGKNGTIDFNLDTSLIDPGNYKVSVNINPGWKILVLVYSTTDFAFTDRLGNQRHFYGALSQAEIEKINSTVTRFVTKDIPSLTGFAMQPTVTFRYPSHSLSTLSPMVCNDYVPDPTDIEADRDANFDSVIAIYDGSGIDLLTGKSMSIEACAWSFNMGTGSTYSAIFADFIHLDERNVLKHEWGHSILYFYGATGAAPGPTINTHINDTDAKYVNCTTGQPYILLEETDDNLIPNSIFNNQTGFTHDYYIGQTANADQPDQCLGVPPLAWASGGPVSRLNLDAFDGNSDTIEFILDLDDPLRPRTGNGEMFIVPTGLSVPDRYFVYLPITMYSR